MTETKIPVGQAAVVKRCQRRLGPDMRLYKSRDGWYVVDVKRSHVTDSQLELESYARRLEALERWERLDVDTSEVHA
jgi:hypothetical protein